MQGATRRALFGFALGTVIEERSNVFSNFSIVAGHITKMILMPTGSGYKFAQVSQFRAADDSAG